MNLQNRLFIILILVSGSLTSCKKEKISLEDTTMQEIFGSWEWVSSIGGFAGFNNSPSSVGYSKTIEFDKYGICKIYKNKRRIQKLKFTLQKEYVNFNTYMADFFINYTDQKTFGKDKALPLHAADIAGSDTLWLYDIGNDGFTHMYVRKK